MTRTAGNVIKNDSVQMAGTVKLGQGGRPSTAVPASAVPAAAQPRSTARIIASQADHVMIEVTCPCGQKTHLRCEYPPQ